ncbi:hypothetical protein [Streptomyces sp. NPDC088135]|uniref:hypothetical protein n=1 Tax=Streptomyces sp. NPDC088135 TaxID=3160993 RepID=UPI0034425F75
MVPAAHLGEPAACKDLAAYKYKQWTHHHAAERPGNVRRQSCVPTPLGSARTTDMGSADKRSFLTLHDYGMGGLWWWIRARTAREVLETFAWVEVVTDPESVARFEGEELAVVDIDDPRMPPGLDGLRAQRDAQRGRSGFGALADRDIVYLRRTSDEDDDGPAVQLLEVGPDGRRIRQVEPAEDGSAVRGRPEDWLFDPPVADLFDPELADQEIDRGEFEEQWARARPADTDL